MKHFVTMRSTSDLADAVPRNLDDIIPILPQVYFIQAHLVNKVTVISNSNSC
jgi:hypothetical protein